MYDYDDNGVLTQKTDGSDTTLYTYDALGNLTALTLPTSTSITYSVDGNDRRSAKKVSGSLDTGYIYGAGSQIIADTSSTGTIKNQYVYAINGHVPSYLIRASANEQIVTDQLGSPRLVINANSGDIQQKITYDVWGNITEDTNPGYQALGFAGGLYDVDTGLTRFGARDYDPVTGRWTSKDPILFAGGDTNLYGYVLNDPVNLIDPNGKNPFIIPIIFGIITGVLTPSEEGQSESYNLFNSSLNSAYGFVTGTVFTDFKCIKSNPRYTPAQLRQFEQQLTSQGRGSLEKSRISLEKRLTEHYIKLDNYRRSGGYTSSIEREINNFQQQIDAIDQILGK